MLKLWNKLSFSNKVVLIFICSLFFTVGLASYNHASIFQNAFEQQTLKNARMLTNQVALNFAENQSNMEETVYARISTFQIPSHMHTYNSTDGENAVELNYALAQTVTNSSDFDFAIIELMNGDRFNTGTKYMMRSEAFEVIHSNSIRILNERPEVTYGKNNWIKCEGGLYILKDVYDVNPLRHVGRLVVHLRKNPFVLSESYEDTSFMFFGMESGYLFSTGIDIPPEISNRVIRSVNDGTLDSTGMTIGDYSIVRESYDNWESVGVFSLAKQKKAEKEAIKYGLLLALIATSVAIVFVLLVLDEHFKNLNSLSLGMNKVAAGDFEYRLDIKGDDDISRLAMTFNYMSNRVMELLDELVEKEIAKKNAEYEMLEYKYRSLETQIRPHFIYNALESINSLAKISHNEEIEDAVQKISRYFRNITVNVSKQFITAEQELNSLRDYTEIYSMIHGHKLEAVYICKERAKHAMIPTMILQPIVENALQHGIKSGDSKAVIRIHAYKKEGRLYITIKDNGNGISKEMEEVLNSEDHEIKTDHGGIGMHNVRERLKLIYGEEAEMRIFNREEGGAEVKIGIPFTRDEAEYGESDIFADLDEIAGISDADDSDDMDFSD